jgi:metal-dependent hydrolase (beta-lactamase superfamily II)
LPAPDIGRLAAALLPAKGIVGADGSGVEKIYALVGDFHFFPASEDYLRQVMAELKKFDLEHVMPMQSSGQNFVDLSKVEMSEKLVLCGTGSTFTFTA